MRDHDVHGREEADEEALDSSAAHRALPLTVRTRMRAFGHSALHGLGVSFPSALMAPETSSEFFSICFPSTYVCMYETLRDL